jgi:hypothetical protein
MTGSTIQFESSNMQNILIALVVICAIVYAFLEFRKINNRMLELEQVVGKIQEGVANMLMGGGVIKHPMNPNVQENQPTNPIETNQLNTEDIEKNDEIIQELSIDNDIEQSSAEKDIVMDSIINQVEEELSQPVVPMSGLFISVESKDERIVEINEEDESPIEEITLQPTRIQQASSSQQASVSQQESVSQQASVSQQESVSQISNQETSSYEEYTIRELKDKLTDMNLPTSGNKSKLIERIISNEKKM